MKWSIIFLVSGVFIFSGCSLRQREMELDKKLTEVNEKEQQLALKEQSLDFREQQLDTREKILDSTTRKIANDSLLILHPQLTGTWAVKMQCIETNCPGSAVGDTKNEQWDFKIQDNGVIASAISNNQLVRVYSGGYLNNSLRLSVQQDSTDLQFAKMTVRLQESKDKEMSGEREIIQANGCRILYTLQLKKQ
jgi:hypothetical protein